MKITSMACCLAIATTCAAMGTHVDAYDQKPTAKKETKKRAGIEGVSHAPHNQKSHQRRRVMTDPWADEGKVEAGVPCGDGVSPDLVSTVDDDSAVPRNFEPPRSRLMHQLAVEQDDDLVAELEALVIAAPKQQPRTVQPTPSCVPWRE